MHQSFYIMSELGRMRTEEALQRANRYRLAKLTEQRRDREKDLSAPTSFLYRKAPRVAALFALIVASGAVLFR